MIGKHHHHHHHHHHHPTAYTSPWDAYTDPTADIFSCSVTNGDANLSSYDALLTALSRYLPSNDLKPAVTELSTEPFDAVNADSDEFRMYEFKVRGCTRPKAHDWTECPFAHPGEKARRRDPRRYSYSGTACTDFRKGGCRRGDGCDFAHGVFECWLHPTRYRTQACKDGSGCTRRVCFFAHSPGQIRVTSGLPSPLSIGSRSPDPFEDSPPLTPVGRAYGSGTVTELATTLRNLQLSKVKSMPTGSGWKGGLAGIDSPRFGPSVENPVRTGFYSLPTTPSGTVGGIRYLDAWEEDPVMEIRPIWENRLDMQEPVDTNTSGSGPDIGWVSELIK